MLNDLIRKNRTISAKQNTKERMMKHLFSIFIATLFLFSSGNLNAQSKWTAEFRSAGAFATQNLGNTDLNAGFGFDIAFAYRLMPHLSTYAGWGWKKFSADQSFAVMDFEETGYTFGLQFIHPIGNSRLNYLLRAGGIFNHIETENNDGEIINDTGHGLGWQLEAGLDIPISEKVSLRPGVRYSALSRDIKISGNKTSVNLNYISAGIGLNWAL